MMDGIKGITDDSRKVKKDFLFVAIKGLTVDGHMYISDAIKKGAKAIVGEEDLKFDKVNYIKVKDSRKELGILASEFYGNPSRNLTVIGVTGTDGKTTTANLIYWILKNANKKTGLVSTINAKIGSKEFDTGLHVTNPDAVSLQELLSKMVKEKCEYAVLEVTSHGLDQERVAGVKFNIGVLTNITHEHLDYHKTFENYVTAKGKLFKNVEYSIINAHNNLYSLIKPFINEESRLIKYDMNKFNSKIKSAIKERFIEKYNCENAAAAIEVVRLFNVSDVDICKAIKTFPQLSGRMEEIKNSRDLRIYVDFAHTPNALENVLSMLSERKGKGRLIAIFGCASERDNEKRPMMAEISTRIADISIFTAEDPRNENIKSIFKDMKKGIKNAKAEVYEIEDRGEAIYFAINKVAKPNDIIIICGKGHEKSMSYNGHEYKWSDQESVKDALERKLYKNKKAAVIGLGIEGKDIINYLLNQNALVTLFDQKPEEELDFTGVNKTKINLICGSDYLKNSFDDFDYVFRSPGIRPDIINKARYITSAIRLFFSLSPSIIIGVTGTKGKGTTSTLIYEILKENGEDVYLAGNIGKPYLELLPKLNKKSIVILEMSSFQLFDLDMSPHISVVLNITLDHMDWHKSREEYVFSKENIVKYQNEKDFAVINSEYNTPKSFAKLTKGKVVFFSKKTLEKKYKTNILLRGEHNLENIAAAVEVAKILKINGKTIQKVISSFKGLEHRLELVRTIKGISFYNDSFSTNPQTTSAAVKSFTEPLTLILGGSDKGLSYDEVAEDIVKNGNVENIILIGQIANIIKNSLKKAKYKGNIFDLGMTTMKEVVDTAIKNSKPGFVVLLSPGTASFGMFHDYKDRGNQFKEVIKIYD
jgi:UDP-N-acetylmuramoyl-L-alanyl-D-glutamate--2,6-diaminopimelate ligase